MNAYTEKLQRERARIVTAGAELATRIVTAWFTMSADDRAAALGQLRLLNMQADAYGQQIAWRNRRTGWAAPSAPAWSD